MSLQIWLPLNGNLDNQGLSNVTINNYGATVDNNGKIGKCYSFNGSSYIRISLPSTITSLKNTTICMWVKGNQAFGGISHDVEAAILPCMTAFGNWQFADGSNYKYISSGSYKDGNWHHIACTVDDTTITTYDNGSIVSTELISSLGIITELTSSNFIELGCDHPGYNEYLTGYINDFRVYDHCLSAKEVKEISKGLVLHYPLTTIGAPNLRSNTHSFMDSFFTLGGFAGTKEVIADEEAACGYTIKITCNTAGTGFCFSSLGKTSDRIGKTFTWSFWAKCSTTKSGSFGDETGGHTSGAFTTEWRKYTKTWVMGDTQYQAFTFYLGWNVGEILYIRDLKFEEGDKATPWCPNVDDVMYTNIGLRSAQITDCSGFGNHGVFSGSINYINNTPRYDCSAKFENNGYIIKSNLNLYTKQFTLSMWINIQACSAQHFLFGTFDNFTVNGIGAWRDSGGTNYSNIIKSDAESSYSSFNPTLPTFTLNTWYHITFVFTGTITKLYINGDMFGEQTYGNNGNVYHPVFMLANSKYNNTPSSENEDCCYSDVRFYATALSSDDVKQLYQTSASIDKNGNMYCYEIKER